MSKMDARKNARGTLQANEEIFKIKKQANKQTNSSSKSKVKASRS